MAIWTSGTTPDKCIREYGGIRVASIKGFECLLQFILNYAIRFAGIAIFIMFLVGGFKYLTSGGDPKATQSAKNTLTYAVFGLVFIILGWFALVLVENLTGAPVTNFVIPTN